MAKKAKNRGGKAVKSMRGSKLSTNTIITIAGVALVVIVIIGLAWYNSRDSGKVNADILVRPTSHKLSTASGGVTVVEFLDFQCPGCGAAFPAVEKLRTEYDGEITYVVRNLPLTQIHPNAMTAARAAEAAAEQGKYVEMYQKLFENQSAWAEAENAAEIFLGYAQELGLDVTKFTADVDSDVVTDRIKRDVSDAEELGVEGTPTFFIDDKKFTGKTSYDGLKTAIDKALDE